MKYRRYILLIAIVVVLNTIACLIPIRFDLTADKRYSISQPTRELLQSLDDDIQAQVLLNGKLNSGFIKLRRATFETLDEMHHIGHLRVVEADSPDLSHLQPTVIHEREQDGRTVQTTIYPYVILSYHGRQTIVPLLRNNRGLTGEQNLNLSIQNLEYALAEAIHSLSRTQVERIAFLEGHGELPERYVYDICSQLSRYFDIDRGVLSNDPTVLDGYKAVVIADPQTAFSDSDKYILDHYLMQGGRILWVVNGVRFSDELLSSSGMTPIMALDLNLSDMFFRYGVRINPNLVQDLQCLTVPVDVSNGSGEPNFQPLPWTYAPLLLTSSTSPVTRDVMQVSASFASTIDVVGIAKDSASSLTANILLATSTASRITPTPGEVDLNEFGADPTLFHAAFLPVAVELTGNFPSFYQHRLPPQGFTDFRHTSSLPTKQIFIACGSIIRNGWQQNQPNPLGFDGYSGIQFGNRDFLTNAVLDLADDSGLINLRVKSFQLRLLNDQRAHQNITAIRLISIAIPLLIIALIALIVALVRIHKYIKDE